MDKRKQVNNKLQKKGFYVISNIFRKADRFQLTINNKQIERTNNIKYLGVHLDDKLSWKTHVDNIAKRLSKTCNIQ